MIIIGFFVYVHTARTLDKALPFAKGGLGGNVKIKVIICHRQYNRAPEGVQQRKPMNHHRLFCLCSHGSNPIITKTFTTVIFAVKMKIFSVICESQLWMAGSIFASAKRDNRWSTTLIKAKTYYKITDKMDNCNE